MNRHFTKLLAITGVAVFTLLLFTGREAYGLHSCVEGTTPECCSECTQVCTDFCLAAAQQAFDDCAALYAATPFLIEIICVPAHLEDVNDCNAHSGNFDFATCMSSCANEGTSNAPACALDQQACVPTAAATKNTCKRSCPSGSTGRDCRDACQATFVDAVKVCIGM